MKYVHVIAIVLLSLPVLSQDRVSAPDVTRAVVNLGNPFAQYQATTWARNVLDMHLFEGKVFFAHGDIHSNSGATPIMVYDPETKLFVSEYTVDDEAILQYVVLGGVLTIPGSDALEDWSYGNFYQRNGTVWKKSRTLPDAVHVWDIVEYDGEWVASVTVPENNSKGQTTTRAFFSTDQGKTWAVSYIPARSTNYFITIDKKLYLQVNPFSRMSENYFEYEGNGAWKAANGRLFPESGWETKPWKDIEPLLSKRSLTVNNITYYLAEYTWYDTFGLWKADSFSMPERVQLPGNARARDIIVRDAKLYVLASTQQQSGAYLNQVFTINTKIEELFNFTTNTFVRSFEELNGAFYFGLGGNGKGPNVFNQYDSWVLDGGILPTQTDAFGKPFDDTTVSPMCGEVLVYFPRQRRIIVTR